MWYQFPEDNETYPLSEQFMIGQSLMVAPAMIQEDTESSVPVTIYFPRGTWLDIHFFYIYSLILSRRRYGL